VKYFNKVNLRIVGNQRGGVAVMIFSLMAFMLCIIVMAVVIDYLVLYTTQNKLKNDLNSAVHAASLSVNENQLSKGFFMLDTTTPGSRAQDMFYKYLQSNMGLDNNNIALANSKLTFGSKLNIDELIYVDFENKTVVNLNTKPTACTMITATSQVTCNVTLNSGLPTQINRTVNQTVIGPSIIAIVDSQHKGLGTITNEPLLITAVQEVFFLKK
jgi:hypothetical protein